MGQAVNGRFPAAISSTRMGVSNWPVSDYQQRVIGKGRFMTLCGLS
jgi:hypothetical protein